MGKWMKEHPEAARKCRREYYARNRASEKARVRARKAVLRQWLQEVKQTLKCKFCPESHPAVLEFHHRDPKKKEIDVAHTITDGWGKKRILDEIAKCDVLCSNCHRKLHWYLDCDLDWGW